MTYAERLERDTRGFCAWNMREEFKRNLLRTTRNGHGTSFLFRDNSRAFVYKGTARVIVK